MDRNAARDLLLTGFKPKEKNIDTPYLGALDGQLKLVGLSGKQSIEMEDQATEQVIERDGTVTNKYNGQKFAGLAIQACLRMRDTGEHVLNLADVLGEKGDGNSELLEMDNEVFKPLVREVLAFLGKKPAAEIKNGSEPTGDGSTTSSSPVDSGEPSENSSTASTQPS